MNNEQKIRFINDTTELNFEINSYDQSTVEFKTVLDFIETFSVGDVF